MKELYVDSCTVMDEAGGNLRFDYYVLIGEMDTGTFFCESYGVAVVQADTGRECRVPNVTVSAARIDRLMTLLLEHAVTPVNLPEVVQDWL